MDNELYIIILGLQYHVTSSGDGGLPRVCQMFAYSSIIACLFVVLSLIVVQTQIMFGHYTAFKFHHYDY